MRRAARRRLPLLVLAALLLLPSSLAQGAPSAPSRPVAAAPGHEIVGGPASPGASPAAAADTGPTYPDNWPMYFYDTNRSGTNPGFTAIGPTNASEVRLLWSVRTGGPIFTSPAVVNGTVYFGSWDGNLYAVNASDGAVRWKTYIGQTTAPNCNAGLPQGVTSSPEYYRGTIYVGGGNDSWYALNASNGSIEWSVVVGDNSVSGGNYNWASPLIYNGSEYIGIASYCDEPQVQGKLIRVNLTGNHSVLATFDAAANGCLGDAIWSTASVDPVLNQIWVGTGDEGTTHGCSYPYADAVVALNGSTLAVLGHWALPNAVGLDSDFGNAPTLVPANGTHPPLAIATNKNGVTYIFNRTNVTKPGWGPIYSDQTSNPAAWPVVASNWNGSTLFVPASYSTVGGNYELGSVWAINPYTNHVDWHVAAKYRVRLPMSEANGILAVPAGENLSLLNATTGATLWTTVEPHGETEVAGSILADGRLYSGAGNYTTSGDEQEYGWFNAYGIPLAANLTANTTALNTTGAVAFQVNTTGGSGGAWCNWNFGDGTFLNTTGCTVTHLYRFAGRYPVSVNVTDDLWETVPLSYEIVDSYHARTTFSVEIVASPPVAEGPTRFVLQADLTGPYTGPASYAWTVGNTSVTNSTAARIVYELSTPGRYPVTVNVTDANGSFEGASTSLTVLPTLSLNASLTPLIANVPFSLAGFANVSGGDAPYSYSWTSDLGLPVNASVYGEAVTTPGSYYVDLLVTDALGFTATAEWNLTAEGPLAPSPLSVSLVVLARSAACSGGPPTTVELAAEVPGASSSVTYAWSFGDGATATIGPIVNHTYASAGSFEVTVRVSEASGANGNATTSVASYIAPTCAKTGTSGSSGASNLYLGVGLGLLGAAVVLGAILIARRRRLRTPPRP